MRVHGSLVNSVAMHRSVHITMILQALVSLLTFTSLVKASGELKFYFLLAEILAELFFV